MCVFVSHPVSLTVVLPFAVVSSPMSNRKNNSQLLQRGQLLSTAHAVQGSAGQRLPWDTGSTMTSVHREITSRACISGLRPGLRRSPGRQVSPAPTPRVRVPLSLLPLADVRLPSRTLRTHLATRSHTPPFSPLRNSRQR